MKNINAIVFDLGGVLLNIDFQKVFNAFKELGVGNFEDMYSQKKVNHLFKHFEEGKISEAEFYNTCRREMNFKITNTQIETAWNSMLLDFRESALKTLLAIRPKYKLYLLSNTNVIHLKKFNAIFENQVGGSIAKYFDKLYYSHEIGSRKPGKESFECVLRENNLTAAHTLFIDDSAENIEGAKLLGFQTIHLTQKKKIEQLGL
ncbi:MAG TPA: HAD family phosphatase [Chitinophagaceae bacterium]|nr:HAD family phosphatase [Chitinophagaceae bacterium]